MKIDIYQVDAFTDSVFGGNTSAVCPLDQWIDDNLMQKIASETNLSKTAFIVRVTDGIYDIRWFTPENEVTLSDHTALASAFVIFNYLNGSIEKVILRSIGGDIEITKDQNLLSLCFQANMPELYHESNPLFSLATGIEPLKVLKEKDFILVYENANIIEELNPKVEVFKSLDLRGVCITALDDESDFVFKYFAPKLGLNEDLMTGSVCSQLVPYWSQVLNKESLKAVQYTDRRSKILCQLKDDKVIIKGEATLFMKGEIIIEERKFPRHDSETEHTKFAVAV